MTINSNNDKILFSRLKSGDTNAFRKIYTNYYNKLCVYVFSFTNNDTIAEDIVQDVLLKLWDQRASINIQTSLKSYLYKAVYYRYIDHFRMKKKTNENIESIRYNTLNELHENSEDYIEQRLHNLRIAIEELSPRCKEVLLLNKIEGYKYREIAKTLNISIKTVEGHMVKALKTLRKKLGA